MAVGHALIHNEKERKSWEVLIVLPGVKIIPELTFIACSSVKSIIMADDSVKMIRQGAFHGCQDLSFVKFSRNLECIRYLAFLCCDSLTSIFIPSSCRKIGSFAFIHCDELTIFNVSQHTEVADDALKMTALYWKIRDVTTTSPNLVAWVKSINDDDEYALHRLCSSMDPSEDEIYQLICQQVGLSTMALKNSIGINPSEYLASNPYADVDEMKLMKRFVLEKMGEIV